MPIEPEDLLDASEVAELIGLTNPRAISVYRTRYDFPDPVIEKSSGKCLLWLRSDVERFAAEHQRRPRSG